MRLSTDKKCNIIVNDDLFNENYVYVYILLLNKIDSYTNLTFIKTEESDLIKFNIGSDGHYWLCTIQVPTDETESCYYKDGIFYKDGSEIQIENLLLEEDLILSLEHYFITCNLRKCYIDICLSIFNSRASLTCDTGQIDKNTIYRRDLILAGLNVIKYLVEMEQYDEAERLLERITGCNGLCKQSNCGCMSV